MSRVAVLIGQLGLRGAFLGAAVVGLGAEIYLVLTINVAATAPDAAPGEWALGEVMERSAREIAEEVEVPVGIDLDDPELAARAIGH